MEDLTLRQIRRAKEITQQQVADYLKIHVNTYQRWEDDPKMISFDNAIKICEFLEVPFSVTYFLN